MNPLAHWHSRRSATFVLTLLALAGVSFGQGFQVIAREGDPAPGIGAIRVISQLATNGSGANLLFLGGDSPNLAANTGLYLNSKLLARRGAPILGGALNGFGDITLDASGNAITIVRLTGSPSGDSGVFWNDRPLVFQGDPCTCPGVPTGAVYWKFLSLRSDHAGGILVQLRLLRSGILADALVLLDVDATGSLVRESLIAMVGVTSVEGGDVVTQITAEGHALARDAVSGGPHWMAMVRAGASLTTDSAILLDGAVLAREGDPAPIPGTRYLDLGGTKLDVNALGENAFEASTDADLSENLLLVKNGAVFAQEGHGLPGVSSQIIAGFPSTRIFLSDSGDLFWGARTSAPITKDDFLMRNDQVLVREGVTQIGAGVVERVRVTGDAFHVSDSGRFWLANVVVGGTELVVLADFGAVVPIPGCLPHTATLRKSLGDARVGGSLRFEMDRGQGPGVLPMMVWSSRPAVLGSPCGMLTGSGELLISLARPDVVGRQVGSPWSGAPVSFALSLPADPSLVNLEFFGQGAFLDPAGAASGEAVRLTNALRMEIGAP